MSLGLSILNFNNCDQIESETKDSSNSLLSLAFINENEDPSSFSKSKLFDSSSDESTESSIGSFHSKKYKNNSIYKKIRKNSLFKKKFRKDINGNVIQKGGKQKVSFKDDIKGNFLVEITLYNAKDNCIKRKNYKDYTFKLLAKDKKALNCSDCTIF